MNIPTPPNTTTVATIELTEANTFDNAVFINLCELITDDASTKKARDYFLDNRKAMNLKSIEVFDWCFGREYRLPAWMTTDLSVFDKFEKDFDRMEADSLGL